MASEVGLRPAAFVLHFISFWMVVLKPFQCFSVLITPPAVFVFGGRLFDAGTNNFLPLSELKANFPFYGIDFPDSVPTGRFSNGYNLADQIVRRMGFTRSPPPFLSLVAGGRPSDKFNRTITRRGANFASGGAGVLSSTGRSFGQVVTYEEQLRQFSTVARNLTDLLGQPAAGNFIGQAIFLSSLGIGDTAEYLQNLTDGRPYYTSDNLFLNAFISQFVRQLQSLYDNGARKYAIVAPPPIGCTPFSRALNSTGGCNARANSLALAIFRRLRRALTRQSASAHNFTYAIGNTYQIFSDLIAFPEGAAKCGLKELRAACCGNGTTPCNPNATLCRNRDEYLFWDRLLPTESAAGIFADAFFSNNTVYVTPISFRQLIDY